MSLYACSDRQINKLHPMMTPCIQSYRPAIACHVRSQEKSLEVTAIVLLDCLGPNSTVSICCGFVLQLVVQSGCNKSTTNQSKWSMSLTARPPACSGQRRRRRAISALGRSGQTHKPRIAQTFKNLPRMKNRFTLKSMTK